MIWLEHNEEEEGEEEEDKDCHSHPNSIHKTATGEKRWCENYCLENYLVSWAQAKVGRGDIATDFASILSKPPALILLPGQHCQRLSL